MSLVGLSANPVRAPQSCAERVWPGSRARAHFDLALRQTKDIRAAFDMAANQIKTWEGESGEKASKQEILIGARMNAKLDQ